MKIVPILLRLILALSLVLNGTGLAAAHAGGGDTPTAASAGADVTPMVELPCHEAPDLSGSGHGSREGKAEGDVSKTAMIGHQADTDCCDVDTCDNACPQPLSAALVAAAVTGLHARPVAHLQAMPATHSGPRLSHPIRPPIT